MMIFMTILTGIVYPLLVTTLAKTFFPSQADGSFVQKNSVVVGSELIGQKFQTDRYFWSRPSASDNNPLPSGGSNLGPTSGELKRQVSERQAVLLAKNPNSGQPPQDLLFASASGLDPDISVESALFQLNRIAAARGWAPSAVRQQIQDLTQPRQFGIFGEPRINVLKLNLALDSNVSP